jgi:phage/plasmid-like protein (TIGR03299 family)
MSIFSSAVANGRNTPFADNGYLIPEDCQDDSQKAISSVGMNWEVQLEPQIELADVIKVHDLVLKKFTEPHLKQTEKELEKYFSDYWLIKRQDTGYVTGCVKKDYNCVQNMEMFKWFDPFLKSGECKLETAGSFHKGKIVWILAKIDRQDMVITGDDKVSKYVLLSGGHDGGTAIRVGFNDIRIWCLNSLNYAHRSDSSNLLRVMHSKDATKNLEAIRNIMNVMDSKFEATAAQYRHLASKQINSKDLEKYVRVIFDAEETEGKEISTQKRNVLEKVFQTIETGAGQTEIDKTYWWALSGVNNYLNYSYGRSSDSRLSGIWFGSAAGSGKMNHQAFNLALEMAG